MWWNQCKTNQSGVSYHDTIFVYLSIEAADNEPFVITLHIIKQLLLRLNDMKLNQNVIMLDIVMRATILVRIDIYFPLGKKYFNDNVIFATKQTCFRILGDMICRPGHFCGTTLHL